MQMLIGRRLSIVIDLFIHSSSLDMGEISPRQLSFALLVSARFLLWSNVLVNALPAEQQIAHARIDQKILIGPHPVNTRPGETIQLPCIVSKQSDAIVTWCWNDFCTLGKAQLIRHETTAHGLISVYQYAAYPRFHLFINERLRTE